jgi:hypothetical protein
MKFNEVNLTELKTKRRDWSEPPRSTRAIGDHLDLEVLYGVAKTQAY